MRGKGALMRSLRESPLWGATREQLDDWARKETLRMDPHCIERSTFRGGDQLGGCMLWYRGPDYDRAYDHADNPPPQIDWSTMTVKHR